MQGLDSGPLFLSVAYIFRRIARSDESFIWFKLVPENPLHSARIGVVSLSPFPGKNERVAAIRPTPTAQMAASYRSRDLLL